MSYLTNPDVDLFRKLRRFPHVIAYNIQRRVLHPILGHILINEYPRSGGSWISNVISAASGIPKMGGLSINRQIIHEHRIDDNDNKQVYVIRDGRDVMVSNYFHSFFANEMNNRGRVVKMKQTFSFSDYHDINANLRPYINRMLTQPVAPPILWQEFCSAALRNPRGLVVKYEDMKERPYSAVRQILDFYEIDVPEGKVRCAVERYEISSHATGRHDRHVRKGVVGDWKNYFDRQCADDFDRLAGEYLIRFGYEPDHSWVERVF